MYGYQLQDNEIEFKLPTPSRTSHAEISCILSKPEGKPTLRAAILMHGIGAHKNTCYQSKLARILSKNENMYVVRFDFRNCGESTKTGEFGRTLQDDIEDMTTVYQYLANGGVEGKRLFVDSLIGHSRGVVDVFNWQLAHKDVFVPNLVACAGRYIGIGLIESIERNNPNFQEKGGHYIQGFQNGRYQKVWVPFRETMSLGVLHMDTVKEITKDTETLCVYGTRENVIPLEDAAMYVNALRERNTVILIPGADHCFRGVDKVPEDQWSTYSKPLKNGLVDYTHDVAEKVAEWVSSTAMQRRFYEKTLNVHTFLPRWKSIDGISIRDIGGWNTRSGKVVKYGRMFRSGDLSDITSGFKLAELGITKVFDLSLDGGKKLESVATESLITGHLSSTLFTDPLTLQTDYIEIFPKLLTLCKPLFDHLLHTNTPFLYYCSNGRDITGLVTMVLLRLAGVEPLLIAQEYALSANDSLTAASNDLLAILNVIRDETALAELLSSNANMNSDTLSALSATLVH